MDRHRTAAALAVSALFLGVAGDLLLRWIPWGINVPLWIAALLAVAFLVPRGDGAQPRPAILPAVCALLAAAGIAWRDAPELVAADVLLLLVLLPMLALPARGVRLASAGLSQIGFALATTGVQAAVGIPQLLFSDISWSRVPRGTTLRTGGVVLRGIAIALPALILFGALLTSADAAFANMMEELFDFDLPDIILDILFTAVVAAICAGSLRSLFFSGTFPTPPRPAFLRLGTSETNIALGLVNLLFAIFVGVQFRYLFRGTDIVRVTKDLTWSEYARRGFFELVLVVALVVPMLLVVEWLIDKRGGGGLRVFRGLALLNIATVLVIAASAYKRMQLYREEFGLTQQRLYTTAFMIWLAAVLIWLAITVLTGRRERFAIGAFVTGMLAVIVLHAINPDAMIVRTNLERAEAGRRAFDAKFAASLSDDAAEVILANEQAFPPAVFATYVDRHRPSGWRTWNWSRYNCARASSAAKRGSPRSGSR